MPECSIWSDSEISARNRSRSSTASGRCAGGRPRPRAVPYIQVLSAAERGVNERIWCPKRWEKARTVAVTIEAPLASSMVFNALPNAPPRQGLWQCGGQDDVPDSLPPGEAKHPRRLDELLIGAAPSSSTASNLNNKRVPR